MNITLRHIRYFIAAANAGQISRAATNIHVSQSAITSAIKTLEDILGATLFERHAQGITLTYEGNLFLHQARHIIETVEEATRIPNRDGKHVSGHINVAMSYTIAGYFLPFFLAKFHRSFPRIQLHLTETVRPDIEEGLITNKFDLAIMLTSNIANLEDISYKTLWKSRRCLWVDAHHRFLHKESVRLQDIASENYIMLTVDEASNTAIHYWKRTEYQPKTIFRTSSVEAVRSMVANGMGVTILSDMVHRPWSLEGRRVATIEVADNIPTMDVGIAWYNRSERSTASKAFIDFMQRGMNTQQHHLL